MFSSYRETLSPQTRNVVKLDQSIHVTARPARFPAVFAAFVQITFFIIPSDAALQEISIFRTPS